MSSFLTYEGTTDFIAVTPALIVTLTASGSISPGRAVVIDTSNNGAVYQPTGVRSGSVVPAGVALTSASDGKAVSVMVWGFAKSLPTLPASDSAITIGQPLVVTGSGFWGASGSSRAATVAGKTLSGSAGFTYAFIDCMSNLGA